MAESVRKTARDGRFDTGWPVGYLRMKQPDTDDTWVPGETSAAFVRSTSQTEVQEVQLKGAVHANEPPEPSPRAVIQRMKKQQQDEAAIRVQVATSRLKEMVAQCRISHSASAHAYRRTSHSESAHACRLLPKTA